MREDATHAHSVGDLAEVLDNLGVFSMHPEEVSRSVPPGSGGSRSPRATSSTSPSRGSPRTSRPTRTPTRTRRSGSWCSRAREGAARRQPGPARGEPRDRSGDRAPPRLRQRGRPDDAPVDPTPPPVGARDHVGPTGGDDRPDDCHWGARAGAAIGAAATATTIGRASSSARTAPWSSELPAHSFLGEPRQVPQLLAVRTVHVDLEDGSHTRLEPVGDVVHAFDRSVYAIGSPRPRAPRRSDG